jgi:hypothetical protein
MTEPRRDQWGRYLLPHPDTGVEQAWTRATTVANTLADRWALEQWGQRNIVYGMGQRPDLYALAASVQADEKEALNRIVAQAQEAAHASSSANLGTALHRLTERIDTGDILDVPDAWKGDVDAYVQTLADHSVKILPELVERIVVVPQVGVAGTFDRIVSVDGELMVADLKTGKHAVTYGMGEIAAQLSLYSRATHMWGDFDGLGDGAEHYVPMPDVSQEQALVIHLPVGEARCELHLVNISIGWFAVELALQVREWRGRKDLSTPFSEWKPRPALAVVADATGDDW